MFNNNTFVLHTAANGKDIINLSFNIRGVLGYSKE